ncbi:MAG: hypothetical protein WC244_00745 [Patescibacteria group bacterium]|jgi:GH24 family phage-related lysozyme (muramidase)
MKKIFIILFLILFLSTGWAALAAEDGTAPVPNIPPESDTPATPSLYTGDDIQPAGENGPTPLAPQAAPAPAAKTETPKTESAPLYWIPNVGMGQFTQGTAVEVSAGRNILGEYISLWYTFLVGVAGLLAMVMIVFGGVNWLTSGGSSSAIGDAKKTISSALIGLTLALLSYVLLQIINPNLLSLKMPSMANITYSGDYAIPHINMAPGGATLANGANGMPVPYQSGAKIPCNQAMDYNQAFTASYEGYNSTPYADQHGYTYGFGHNSNENPGTVDYNTELQWFTNNYNNTYYPGAATAYTNAGGNWDTLPQQDQAVLADTAYQFGTNSSFLSQTATFMAQGDMTGAASFMRSNYKNYFKTDPGKGVASRINSNASIVENKDPSTGTASDGAQQFNDRASSSCQK